MNSKMAKKARKSGIKAARITYDYYLIQLCRFNFKAKLRFALLIFFGGTWIGKHWLKYDPDAIRKRHEYKRMLRSQGSPEPESNGTETTEPAWGAENANS